MLFKRVIDEIITMKKPMFVLGLFLVLVIYGSWKLILQKESVINVYLETDFTMAPDGIVGFPSWNASTAKELTAGPDFAEIKVNGGGLLVLPPQASKEKPVPAVVILHGSGGDWTGRSIYLANRLAKHGIAGFAVDTFVARNLRSTDDYFERLQRASIYTQIIDGFNALKALQQHPYIDGENVAVTGFSLGGGSTLYSMFEAVATGIVGKDGPRFSAYASFYAGCSLDFEEFEVEGSPVLIMMGEADESMSIERCEWFKNKLEQFEVDVEMAVYEGAGHGWEQPYPQAFVPRAAITKDCLMLWTKNNEVVEQNSGYSVDNPWGAFRAFSNCSTREGYTMGLNEAAKEQSWLDFYAFLKKTHLK